MTYTCSYDYEIMQLLFTGGTLCVVALSRQMSLWKDLVMEPSQLGSLKGLKRDKGHEGYTGSASYGEGKSLLQLRWNY